MDEESVLQLLESRGIVESVMESLKPPGGGRSEVVPCVEEGEGVRGCVGEMVEKERLDQRTGEEVPRKGVLIHTLVEKKCFVGS